MTFEIKYIRYYKNKNVTDFQKVNAIDKTHALKIFKKWAYKKFKAAKSIVYECL